MVGRPTSAAPACAAAPSPSSPGRAGRSALAGLRPGGGRVQRHRRLGRGLLRAAALHRAWPSASWGARRCRQAERVQNSTRRELLGCERALRLFVGPLPDQQAGGELIFLIDNQGAAEGLEMGSPTMASSRPSSSAAATTATRGAWSSRRRGRGATRRRSPSCDFQGKRRDDQAWQLAPALFEPHQQRRALRRHRWATRSTCSPTRTTASCQPFGRGGGAAALRAAAPSGRSWDGKNLCSPTRRSSSSPRWWRRRGGGDAALTLVCQYDPQRLWWPLVRPGARAVVATRRFKATRRQLPGGGAAAAARAQGGRVGRAAGLHAAAAGVLRCARGCCGGSGGAERAFCSFRLTTSPTRRFVQVGGRLPLGPRRAARRSARRPGGGRTRQTARCARFRPPRNSGLFGYFQNSGALGVFRFISISPISPAAPSRAARGQ